MSRLIVFATAAVLAAGSAAAQGQPGLLLQAEGQILTGTCTGQPVRLEGNHNVVTLTGACGSLQLNGVGNTVRMGVASGASIHVEGSGNRVQYAPRGAPPTIVALGPDNNVAAGEAPAAATSTAPSVPPPSIASGAAPAPAAAPPRVGPLALVGDDEHRREDCAGRDVTVIGTRSDYVLQGGCKSITVTGNLLTVRAEIIPGAKIAITGKGSIVSWEMRGRGRGPVPAVRGAGSRVQAVASR